MSRKAVGNDSELSAHDRPVFVPFTEGQRPSTKVAIFRAHLVGIGAANHLGCNSVIRGPRNFEAKNDERVAEEESRRECKDKSGDGQDAAPSVTPPTTGDQPKLDEDGNKNHQGRKH